MQVPTTSQLAHHHQSATAGNNLLSRFAGNFGRGLFAPSPSRKRSILKASSVQLPLPHRRRSLRMIPSIKIRRHSHHQVCHQGIFQVALTHQQGGASSLRHEHKPQSSCCHLTSLMHVLLLNTLHPLPRGNCN